MKRTSLTDVAKAANVSVTLVSLVLNDRGDAMGISKETQQRVIALAKELNYRPNQLARSLRTQKTHTIGLITPTIADRFFARIATSIEQRASQNGYQVLFSNTFESREMEIEQINMFRDRGVDGLIITPTQLSQEWVINFEKSNFPFVLIDRYFPDIPTNSITFENFQGAYQAVSHLLSQGFQNIAQITLHSYLTVMKERNGGYQQALSNRNIPINPQYTKEIRTSNMLDDIIAALTYFRSLPQPPDAIFSHNVLSTEMILEAALHLGLKIPDDFALVSFGHHRLFKLTHPPVSAVHIPEDEIGVKAVDLLLSSIENEHHRKNPRQVVLPTDLIPADSTNRPQ